MMTKARFPDAHLLSCFTNLIFMQQLLAVRHGNGKSHFDVIGPDGPILAIVGKDMELPCHLSPNISAENMELRWYRDHFSPAVYLYQKGKDVSEEQMEEYWGRTVLVRDHITKGKAAVKIRGVTLFDNGTYRCQFKDGTFFAEATLWIKVAGLGLQPRISLRDDEDESLLAKCTSTSWYPEPQVEWRDFEGKPIPSVTNLSVSATSGLFSVVSSVMIKEMATEGLSCSIVNPLLLEKKAAEIYVPAAFSRKHQSTAWSIVLPLILMTLALIVAAALCIFGKRQRERNRQMLEEIRKRAEEEQRRPASTNVSPLFDPDTSSPRLILSEDLRSVSRLVFEQELPNNPERFDQDPCVLCQERFITGKYSWEVEVGIRRAWNVGVCLESLARKGRIPKSPQHGLWAVEFYKKKLWALTFPRTRLHPSDPLHRVRIRLDCEAGTVSFWNGANGSHIYTFSGVSFSDPLRPFFCLWVHDPRPLRICPVSQKTGEVTGPLQVTELPQSDSVTPLTENAESFSRSRNPARTRLTFLSPQSSPVLGKKLPPSTKSQLNDMLV